MSVTESNFETRAYLEDERRSLVVRIGESPQFQRSPRLREFLFFICEKYLQNSSEDLKEYYIGCHVFNRPDYNPAEDNIVRVEARMLRKRLGEYFEAEGKNESIVLTIPKGSYIPMFEAREKSKHTAALPEAATAPAAQFESAVIGTVTEPEISLPRRSKVQLGLPRWIWPVLTSVLLVLCIAGWTRRTRAPAVHTNQPVHTSPLWPNLFSKSNNTVIVCADSALVLWEDITHTPVNLAAYLHGDFARNISNPPYDLRELLELLPNKQYTSIADIRMVERLQEINSENWGRTSIRSARTMNTIDFKSGNSILLGSPRANPWTELFEPQLNFIFEYDDKLHQPLIRNRAPRQGEQSVYRAGREYGRDEDTFSVIAYLPNLTHTGDVLIVAGATMEGTEAAGEYMMNEKLSTALLNGKRIVQHGKLSYFEVLLKSGTLEGTAKNSQMVGYRVLPG